MAEDLVVYEGQRGRLARLAMRLLRMTFRKQIRVIEDPTIEQYSAGQDHGRPWPTPPDMRPLAALNAPAHNAYLYAAVSTVSADFAAVPLTVMRGRGGKAERIEDHPFLDLIREPNSNESETKFRRQLLWDYHLNGWAVALKVRDPVRPDQTLSLIRLHPDRCQVRTNRFGFLSSVEYDGGDGAQSYAREDLLWFAKPGWRADPGKEYGLGWVQPLKLDLLAERNIQNNNARLFETGSPGYAASVRDPASAPMGANLKKQEDDLNRQMKRRHGGVVLMNGSYDLTQLQISSREAEGVDQRNLNRQGILAGTHVPPIKVGLETANYATAQQQDKEYWTFGRHEQAEFESEFSKIARELSGDGRDRVVYDYSDVAAFQESRSERLNRVTTHILNGMSTADAYAYEGFADAPFNGSSFTPPKPLPRPQDETTDPESVRSIRDLLTGT